MSINFKVLRAKISLSCLVLPPRINSNFLSITYEFRISFVFSILVSLQTITIESISSQFKKVSIGYLISSLFLYKANSLSDSNLSLKPAASSIPKTFNIFL